MDARGQEANAGGKSAALVVNVGAEAAHGIARETEVYGFFLLQLVVLAGIHQRQNQVANIVGRERRPHGGSEGSIHAQSYRCPGDQQQVGRILASGEGQQPIDRAVALEGPAGIGFSAGREPGAARFSSSTIRLNSWS